MRIPVTVRLGDDERQAVDEAISGVRLVVDEGLDGVRFVARRVDQLTAQIQLLHVALAIVVVGVVVWSVTRGN